jgi:hypothetical protein
MYHIFLHTLIVNHTANFVTLKFMTSINSISSDLRFIPSLPRNSGLKRHSSQAG